MESNIQRTQLALRYLKNELTPEERYEFEGRMFINPLLREEVEFQEALLLDFHAYDEEVEQDFFIAEVVKDINIDIENNTNKLKFILLFLFFAFALNTVFSPEISNPQMALLNNSMEFKENYSYSMAITQNGVLEIAQQKSEKPNNCTCYNEHFHRLVGTCRE